MEGVPVCGHFVRLAEAFELRRKDNFFVVRQPVVVDVGAALLAGVFVDAVKGFAVEVAFTLLDHEVTWCHPCHCDTHRRMAHTVEAVVLDRHPVRHAIHRVAHSAAQARPLKGLHHVFVRHICRRTSAQYTDRSPQHGLI